MDNKIKEKIGEGYLHCMLLIELVGTPKKHIEDTFALVVRRFSEEEDVHVIEGKVHPVEAKENYFSTFAEMDALIKDFKVLTRIIFDYLPSSIEIIEPHEFRLPSLDMTHFVNDVVGGLHLIDLRLKHSNSSRAKIEENATIVLRNFVSHILRDGPKTVGQLSDKTGLPLEQMKKFMRFFEKHNVFSRKNDVWEKV